MGRGLRGLVVVVGALASLAGLVLLANGTGTTQALLTDGRQMQWAAESRGGSWRVVRGIGHAGGGVGLIALGAAFVTFRPAGSWPRRLLPAAVCALGSLLVLASGAAVALFLAGQVEAATPPSLAASAPVMARSIRWGGIGDVVLGCALALAAASLVIAAGGPPKRASVLGAGIAAAVAWAGVIGAHALSLTVDALARKELWGVYWVGSPSEVARTIGATALGVVAIPVGSALLALALRRRMS